MNSGAVWEKLYFLKAPAAIRNATVAFIGMSWLKYAPSKSHCMVKGRQQ